MRQGQSRHISKTQRILSWFKQNPGWPSMTIGEIQRLLTLNGIPCSHGLVQRARRIASDAPPRPWVRKPARRAAPLLEPLGGVVPGSEGGETSSDLVPAKEVVEVLKSNVLTTDQKREMLTRLAEDPELRPEAKIAAINALHKIDESIGKTKELGPGPPLTAEARAERLGLLIAACGPDVHRMALRLAQKEWKAGEDQSAQAPESPASS